MDMKRYINLIGLLFCLLVWNACVDEDVVKKQKEVIDGIPTTVSLSFATEDADKVSTRSAQKNIGYMIYLLLFSSKKEMDGKKKFLQMYILQPVVKMMREEEKQLEYFL